MRNNYTTPKLLTAYILIRQGRGNSPAARTCVGRSIHISLPTLLGGQGCVDLSTYIGYR